MESCIYFVFAWSHDIYVLSRSNEKDTEKTKQNKEQQQQTTSSNHQQTTKTTINKQPNLRSSKNVAGVGWSLTDGIPPTKFIERTRGRIGAGDVTKKRRRRDAERRASAEGRGHVISGLITGCWRGGVGGWDHRVGHGYFLIDSIWYTV